MHWQSVKKTKKTRDGNANADANATAKEAVDAYVCAISMGSSVLFPFSYVASGPELRCARRSTLVLASRRVCHCAPRNGYKDIHGNRNKNRTTKTETGAETEEAAIEADNDNVTAIAHASAGTGTGSANQLPLLVLSCNLSSSLSSGVFVQLVAVSIVA